MPTLRVQDITKFNAGDLAQHQIDTASFSPRVSRDAIKAKLAEPHKLADEFGRKIAGIGADPNLTAQGKAAAKAEAARALLQAADGWHAPLATGLDDHERTVREKLGAAMAPKTSDVGERVERALLRGEIRRQVAGLDSHAIELFYRNGDATIRQALEELPRIEAKDGIPLAPRPYITAELKNEVLLETAKREHAELAAALGDIESTRGVYRTAFTTLRAAAQEHLDADPVLR